MASTTEWRGFYMEGGQRVPMIFQDMTIKVHGEIEGSGTNSSGGYTIEGRALINGDFKFRLISKTGVPDKHFQGQVMGDGTLRGTFSTIGYPPTNFELKTKMDNWTGTYIQNGRKNELKLNFHSGVFIFGVGRDTTGLFIINGTVNTSNYSVEFVKSYPSKFNVKYNGKMVNNGIFWVINGNWSIGSTTTGEFEIFKEAPSSQKFQPNMPDSLPPMGGGFGRGGGMMPQQPPMMMNMGNMQGGGVMMQPQPVMMMQPQPQMMMQQQPQMMMYQPNTQPQQMMMYQQPNTQGEQPFMKQTISKFSLPSSGSKEDINDLVIQLAQNNMMIEGKTVAYYIKKIPYERDVKYFLEKIEDYLLPCTSDEVVETMKRTMFIRCKVQAAKVMMRKISDFGEKDKEKILFQIVFVDEKNDLERFIDNGFSE